MRSRAAFKLEDLAGRVLRPGARVLDLGAWPGGWIQIAARLVGAQGRVVGIDLRGLDPLGLSNVHTVEGDVRDPAMRQRLADLLGGPADAVLSDMAPKLSGIRDRDEAQFEELTRLALDVAREMLAPGGGFLCKVFMNRSYRGFVDEVKKSFEEVTATRPDSTRKGSAELYVIGRGRRRIPS